MKKCPFCGTEIEDSARFCLYCMMPLGEKEQICLKKRKKPRWLLIVAAIVVAILILIIVLFFKHKTPDNKDSSRIQNNNSALSSIETESTTATHDQIATQPPNQTTQITEPTTTQPITQIIIQSTTEPHEHSYTVKNAITKYLKKEADCVYPATYYYSCFCGKKGNDTFYHGKAKGHTQIVEPGYPASCINEGLTDKKYCSVCGTISAPAWKISAIGHIYALDTSSGCLDCGAKETATIKHEDFPIIVDNTYRVDSGTYRIVPIYENTWMITFTFNYTNISSGRTLLCPNVRLRGVVQAGTEHGSLAPNESGTFKAKAQIHNPNGPYTLVLE